MKTQLLSKKIVKSVNKFLKKPQLAHFYVIASVAILLLSTIAWAWVGSLIELGNADQLANTFIAQHLSTALLPDQHTFLLKIPFFWLVNLMGATPFAFCFVTVLVTLLTVGLFALILFKIERRPYYIGTIVLALALVLMMVPAQSYAGANLPVNMAMLTTRNLEYIIYITALILIVTAKRWLSMRLVGATVLLLFLIASDKLFLSISIGAAVILFIVSLLWRRSLLRSLAIRWFVVSLLAAVGATFLLLGLSSLGWLQSVGQGSVGPYGLVTGVKSFIQAGIYAVLSLLTNFGANPGFDGRTVPTVVSLAFSRLASPLFIVYAMTLAIFIAVIIATVRTTKIELKKLTAKKKEIPLHFGLTIALVASTVTAVGLYIISNHYYPVDARYVTIALFAGFIGVTAYTKSLRKLHRGRLITTGILLVIGIALSSLFVTANAQQQKQVTSDITSQNDRVAEALTVHPVDTLLGDYWRVMPIKLASFGDKQTIDPLTGCTTSREVLSNTAWRQSDTSRSFAYLLTIGASQNFPTCGLDQVTKTYGRPDSSVVISGTERHPKELLLFYDKGIHHSTRVNANLTDTVIPIPLAVLPYTACNNDTIMNIVAHEDDDILFMNPDVLHEIQAGNCIRTIYITAGDAGSDGPYWLGRQEGAEAAYAAMLGLTNPTWTERRIILSPTETITVANPRGIHTVSLIFMHLPDGSPNGQGYAHSGYESLMKLYTGRITKVTTVDQTSTYTSNQVVDALVNLINTYEPSAVQAQSTQSGSGEYIDHSDHTAVGHFVQKAITKYNDHKDNTTHQPVTATYYLGYPIHNLPDNVSGEDFTAKTNTFLTFGQYDNATCHTLAECDNAAVYGIYLRRQYRVDN